MLIRSEDCSVYNLTHIERLEIASSSDIGNAAALREDNASGEATHSAEETYVLRAYIGGKPHDLVGPTTSREEAETALNRIFNMVSERADLHRPNASSGHASHK